MHIDIQARDFSLTGALMSEVEKRITWPLGKRHDVIQHVSVRLGDVNGPKGGRDKYCRIRVEMPGHNDVFVEDIESDLYTAIYRAADRVSRTVSRRVSRMRERLVRSGSRHIEPGSDGQVTDPLTV